jgi:hypothetical protein
MNSKFEFENQRPDENVILIKKRHPFVLAKTGWFLLLLALLLVISFFIWGASSISVIILIAILLLAFLISLMRWFVYSNDLFILTNERIINIEQYALFSRRVTEAELANILNVSYEIKGIVKSFLNFGDITIDTSGSDTNFLVLKNIENPHFIQEKIVNLQKKAQGDSGASFGKRPN